MAFYFSITFKGGILLYSGIQIEGGILIQEIRYSLSLILEQSVCDKLIKKLDLLAPLETIYRSQTGSINRSIFHVLISKSAYVLYNFF